MLIENSTLVYYNIGYFDSGRIFRGSIIDFILGQRSHSLLR
jgi:hypothetical protein